jgi:hypothetical protein
MSVLTETYTLSNGNQIPKIGFGTWLLNEGGACYHVRGWPRAMSAIMVAREVFAV